MDDDDDFYDPTDATPGADPNGSASNTEFKMADVEEGEEGEDALEESDEGDDSEVEFITTAKEQSKTEPQTKRQNSTPVTLSTAPSIPTQTADPRAKTSTPLPRGTSSTPSISHAKQPSNSTPSNERPGSSYPAHHTSTIDLNANPVHPITGKPIQSTDFDVDFPSESSKPWRKPGSDITDYFNYGFDEFTWASYCLKQQTMPKEVAEIKQQAEGMKAFVEGIGGPGGGTGVPGMAPNGNTSGGMPPMPGMPSDAEMQQMFGSMMAQGINPSTMDPNQFMQMMMSGGMGGAGGSQDAGFGGATPSGPAAQGMGFGGNFDQRGGNFAGRGRGRGRW